LEERTEITEGGKAWKNRTVVMHPIRRTNPEFKDRQGILPAHAQGYSDDASIPICSFRVIIVPLRDLEFLASIQGNGGSLFSSSFRLQTANCS
jgi:hypothetical protein